MAIGFFNSVSSNVALMVWAKFCEAESDEEEFGDSCSCFLKIDSIEEHVVGGEFHIGQVFEPASLGAVILLVGSFGSSVPDSVVYPTVE